MYEHRHQPLLPFTAFLHRILRNVFIAGTVTLAALLIGILGYRFTEDLPWIDALLNASMILGGMGPVNELHTTGGKLFASWYALFSGVVFITSAGILVAPVLHRFLHHFHLESE